MKSMVNKNGLACSSPPQLSAQTDSDPGAALPHSDSTPATLATAQGQGEQAALPFLREEDAG